MTTPARRLAAGIALAVVATTFGTVGPAVADPYGSHPDTCGAAVDGGEWTSAAGVVTPAYPHDWLGHTSQANQRTFHLRRAHPTNDDDVNLEIWQGCPNTGLLLCASSVAGASEDVCTVTVTGRVNVHVVYAPPALRGTSNWRMTVDLPPHCRDGYDNDGDGLADYPFDPGCTDPTDTSELSSAPACSDQADNDGDGRIDYPLDPGCTDANDPSEEDAPGPCPPTAPEVVVCLTPSTQVFFEQVVAVPGTGGGTPHRVFGYVARYSFTAFGVETILPCVVVGVDSAVDPCRAAGGVPLSEPPMVTLVDTTVSEPGGSTPLATVRVCHATIRATVAGLGVQSAPAFALC